MNIIHDSGLDPFMNKSVNRKPSFFSKKIFNVVLCLLPLLCFVFFKTEWMARLIAVAGCFGMLNTLLFISGLNNKVGFSVPPPPSDRKETEKKRRDRNAPRVVKVVTIIFACLLFWFFIKPVIEDCIGVIQSGYPYLFQLEGTVRNNQGVFGMRSVLQNFVVVEKGKDSGKLYSAVFFRKMAKDGRAYHFIIAPKSKIVLEWEDK